MVEDIRANYIISDKSKEEVIGLLGTPDEASGDTFRYDVITISRCYLWKCRLEVAFDPQNGKASYIAVSD